VSAATRSAQASALAPAAVDHRAVPARARELAARLSELFEQDVEIVERLNKAQRQLTSANERLWSGLAPDAFGPIYDGAAAAAIATSPIGTLIRDGGPAANSQLLEALQQAHWKIHRAFCAYQHACEQRRQLAIDVGECSQQLTQALCATGWSAHEARHANVHELAAAAS
jgi:hypothetical protein